MGRQNQAGPATEDASVIENAGGIVGNDRLLDLDEEPGRNIVEGANSFFENEDGSIMTKEERMRALRNEYTQEALPMPPELRGWHTCWLSTTNTQDPISRRVKIGYRPVKFAEVSGFDISHKLNAGQYEGCVACNEMILFKIPQHLYMEAMELFHDVLPREEEDKIKRSALEQEEKSASTSARITRDSDDEGFSDLARRPNNNGQPKFS